MQAYLTSEDTIYYSDQAWSTTDIPVSDKPDTVNQYKYNREEHKWEKIYEPPTEDDLSIGEAERLYSWLQTLQDNQGNPVGDILLKLLNL